jgi:hypothetical protein
MNLFVAGVCAAFAFNAVINNEALWALLLTLSSVASLLASTK